MKISKIIYTMALLAGMGLVSCNDELAEPPSLTAAPSDSAPGKSR